MPRSTLSLGSIAAMLWKALVLGLFTTVTAQPSPEELRPLYDALAKGPPAYALSATSGGIFPRVPLSTNDDTPSPLVDLQVYAPPVVPKGGTSCDLVLLTHEFGDGSYGVPAVSDYSPPTDGVCGTVGKWAAITLNVTVYSYVLTRTHLDY